MRGKGKSKVKRAGYTLYGSLKSTVDKKKKVKKKQEGITRILMKGPGSGPLRICPFCLIFESQ